MKRAIPYVALLAMACGCLAYFCTLRTVYLYKRSTWFSSLETKDAARLRATVQSLIGFQLSSMSIQNTQTSLQNNVNYLAKIRRDAPQEIWPILDLRLAKDYAIMARLEQQSGRLTEAARNVQSARTLLQSLGWRDFSDDSLNGLADRQLHSRSKK